MRDGLEASQTIGTRTACEAQEECLCHIIGMVSCGDGIQMQCGGHAGEECKANAPSRHLDGLATPPPHAGAQGVEGEPVLRGKGFDETGVVRRIWSQAMIDMKDDGVEAVCFLQVCHENEQGNRIGSA